MEELPKEEASPGVSTNCRESEPTRSMSIGAPEVSGVMVGTETRFMEPSTELT